MIRTYNLRFYTSVSDANNLTATKLMNRQPCCLANNTAVVLGPDTIVHVHQLENDGRKCGDKRQPR